MFDTESFSKLHFLAEVLFLENSMLTCKRYKARNGMRLQANSLSSSVSCWSQQVQLIIWCHLTNGYISQACIHYFLFEWGGVGETTFQPNQNVK